MGKEYGGEITATFTVPPQFADDVHSLIGQDIDLQYKKYLEKRSLDQNNLMWAVCAELGEALHIPSIEVYRNAVRDIGVYIDYTVSREALQEAIKIHQSRGIAWLVDIIDDTCDDVHVRFYHGSSVYTTEQMSRLLDWLIDEAEQIGIVLKAGPELERLAKEYGK